VVDGDPGTWWTASGTSGEWLSFDFGSQAPVIRSLYVRSRSSWPNSVFLEESTDGTTWKLVMSVDDFSDNYMVNVVGTEGGSGGAPTQAFRFKKGTGFAMEDLCHLLPCDSDDASYSVVTRFALEGVEPTTTGERRILSPKDSSNGVVLSNGFLKIVGSEFSETGGTYVHPFSWTRLAMSFSKTTAVTINVDGNTDFKQLDGGYAAALSLSDTMRLFNDGGNDATCSVSANQGSGLLAELMIYDRPLSIGEADNAVESMRRKCGGTPGECSDHGYCRDGTCVCERSESEGGWKGEHCEFPTCAGIPECQGRGACTADLTCECAEGYFGDGCQYRSCPGSPPCNDNGECIADANSATCQCRDGFHGSDCSLKYCAGDSVAGDGTYTQCSGNGVCNSATGYCTCNSNVISHVSGYDIASACEGATASLSCSDGVIHVMSARFGRLDTGSCSSIGDMGAAYGCHAENSLGVVRQECEGKMSCSITPSTTLFGGDPCSGIHKQLLVSYGCVTSAGSLTPVHNDCSLTIPEDGLLVDLDSATYTGGTITTRGSAGVTFGAVNTQVVDGSKSWPCEGQLVINGGGLQFPQVYSVAYLVNFRESNGGWRTLMRGNSDHHVIVYSGRKELGMYSNRKSGFRGLGYNIQMGWEMLYTAETGSCATCSSGNQQFAEFRSNDRLARYRGATDRAISGTTLNKLGWPGQNGGAVARMLVWDRHLNAMELMRLWDAAKGPIGLEFFHHGCYQDVVQNPILPSLEGDAEVAKVLVGDPPSREDPIDACARAAWMKGHPIFAIQRGGYCHTADATTTVYTQYGTSSDCSINGRGGDAQIDVYEFVGTV